MTSSHNEHQAEQERGRGGLGVHTSHRSVLPPLFPLSKQSVAPSTSPRPPSPQAHARIIARVTQTVSCVTQTVSCVTQTVSCVTQPASSVTQVIPLLLPYMVAVTFTAFVCWPWMSLVQLCLEFLTLGGWNPAVLSWSQNPPLWVGSTVLTYHYAAPTFLRWTHQRSSAQLVGAFIVLYAVRSAIALGILMVLPNDPVYQNIIHVWAPVQVSSPLHHGPIWADLLGSDVLERPYTVAGGGVPPLTPPTSLPLDPLPPSLLLL